MARRIKYICKACFIISGNQEWTIFLLWAPDLSQGFTSVITSLKWRTMTLHAMASAGTGCVAKLIDLLTSKTNQSILCLIPFMVMTDDQDLDSVELFSGASRLTAAFSPGLIFDYAFFSRSCIGCANLSNLWAGMVQKSAPQQTTKCNYGHRIIYLNRWMSYSLLNHAKQKCLLKTMFA